jgi:hypothetical protein
MTHNDDTKIDTRSILNEEAITMANMDDKPLPNYTQPVSYVNDGDLVDKSTAMKEPDKEACCFDNVVNQSESSSQENYETKF